MKRSEEMRELLARWKHSGQSLMAFGKQEGVSYSKLLYWRRRLRGEAEVKEAHAGSGASFVPVKIVADSTGAAPRPEPFEVWLANGVALNIAAGFDEHELRRLVDVLSTC